VTSARRRAEDQPVGRLGGRFSQGSGTVDARHDPAERSAEIAAGVVRKLGRADLGLGKSVSASAFTRCRRVAVGRVMDDLATQERARRCHCFHP